MSSFLPAGVYPPVLSFYKEDGEQSIDLDTSLRHAIRMAKAGVKGVVLQGSTGEAVSLTRQERKEIIQHVRKGLDQAGFKQVLVLAGSGGQSLNEATAYCKDAGEAGAAAVLTLSPSFFVGQMTDDVLVKYFHTLADRSPIPILIYNFPGVTNGINLSATTIARLGGHAKIVGTKLTCNTISKMVYLSPQSGNIKDFAVFTGGSDYLPSAYAAGIRGPITGMANLFPKTIVHLFESVQKGDKAEVDKVQALVNGVETQLNLGFVPASRAVLVMTSGYGGVSRLPLPKATDEEVKKLKELTKDLWTYESQL